MRQRHRFRGLCLSIALAFLAVALGACSSTPESAVQEKPYKFDSARWKESTPHPRDLAQEIVDRSLLASASAQEVFDLLGPNDSAANPVDPAPDQVLTYGWSTVVPRGPGTLYVRFVGDRVIEVGFD